MKSGLPARSYYGRRLDPNTKAFSAAYNDAVDIANKNRLTFLALEYAKNPENMRLQCVFSHFQRRKTGVSILQPQLNSISSLWNLRKIDEIWASSPFIWEIIETGEAGFAQTIRPRSALASDRKSIKITMKFSGCVYSESQLITRMRDHKNRGGRFCANNSTPERS